MGFLGVGSAQGVAVLHVSGVTSGKAFTLTEVQVPSPKGGDTESESERASERQFDIEVWKEVQEGWRTAFRGQVARWGYGSRHGVALWPCKPCSALSILS